MARHNVQTSYLSPKLLTHSLNVKTICVFVITDHMLMLKTHYNILFIESNLFVLVQIQN
jgi:hypothetical protein